MGVEELQAVILCGGMGTRLREETQVRPKPLVEIGGRPILWHIMRHYRAYGVRRFVLCLGYRGEMIRDYFLNYKYRHADIAVDIGRGAVAVLPTPTENDGDDWHVVLADTGAAAQTGARVLRVRRHIGEARFLLTYGDGVSDVDPRAALATHTALDVDATVTAVRPGSRFGEIDAEEDGRVLAFAEKPQVASGWINGGFMTMERAALDGLSDADDLVLERDVLSLWAKRGRLGIHRHTGFWQCMDTYRELQILNEMWERGDAPWTPKPTT